MDLVIDQLEKITIKVLGNEFSLTLPSVKQTRKFTHDMKDAMQSGDDDKSFDIIKSYLLPLGMPEEVFEDLQVSILLKICEMLNKGKKN